ncbi:MAG: hypothetical protein QW360_03435 [Thermofilum sp.]
MTETLLRCDPYEDLDNKIREMYLDSSYRLEDIAEELGRSRTYVINRVSRMVKRGELTPRGRDSRH